MKRDQSHSLPPERFSFGPFSVATAERRLLRDGEPVQIGGRPLDLLIALVRNAGEVVTKRDLLEQVWRGVSVDEGTLRVHVNSLRKTLGDGQDGARYINNVPGQGYVFVAPVAGPAGATGGALSPDRPARVPPSLGRTIGRDQVAQTLAAQVLDSRFVSLVGPGGIGKTTVAVKASHLLQSAFHDDIHFINLSVIADPALVQETIASILGVNTGVGDPVSTILEFLKRDHCLLVLDSCEHLVEPVAALAERIFTETSAHLLMTTREPLRVDGEQVVRLEALACPPVFYSLTASACLAFPAVELFVDRVSSSIADFELTDENALSVAAICRKLDGIPLAIELGAGCVEAYGLAGTANLLERRLGLLGKGRRTAPLRHQTLQATLDWSYELLEAAEQTVFARLAVFAAPFTLQAAEATAASDEIGGVAVLGLIGSLIAKSLVAPVPGRSPYRYRLLDTTRTYALQKLRARGDFADVARRHALFLASEVRQSAEDGGVSDAFIDNLADVRAALTWCFLEDGDAAAGVGLATAAATPLLELSLCAECERWTKLALANLADDQRGGWQELELQTSLGWSAMFSAGDVDTVNNAFVRGLEITDEQPDAHQRLRLLNGLSFVVGRRCDFQGCLDLAEQASAVAHETADPSLIVLSEWALGVAHHLVGHQAVVEQYCASATAPLSRSPYTRNIAAYGYDYRGRALVAQARALWLRGYPDRAAAAAHFAIQAVDQLTHPVSRLVVLVYASTVFIWCSDWASAEVAIGRLLAELRLARLPAHWRSSAG